MRFPKGSTTYSACARPAGGNCASTGCAVYTVLRTYSGAGSPVELERLLLPFGKNGRVKIVVASLQLTNPDERSRITKDFEAQLEIVASARISAASINNALERVSNRQPALSS